MHIPDGYLSPQTALPVLAGMVPVWAVAFSKTKKKLNVRQTPTLALCSAFAFVLMMFNIPVAGGSSAHAVGAVFIAILLGPSAATVSVSTALLIQALIFGDGGIISFGVNCLNMAVIMPFAGVLIHRAIAGKSSPGSRRYLAGAFLGSYFGLNIAAACAGFELGIQPLLFKTAASVPLYCPYPLWVSVPAMMLAHGLFAGPLEGIVTVAALKYISKYAPNLMSMSGVQPAASGSRPGFFKKNKALILPLAILAVLAPVGLIASGTAFGEWDAGELRSRLGYIPKGLASMSDRWHALLPDYGFPLGEGHALSAAGYIISAVAGMAIIAGLIILTSVIVTKSKKGSSKDADTGKRKQ